MILFSCDWFKSRYDSTQSKGCVCERHELIIISRIYHNVRRNSFGGMGESILKKRFSKR